MTTEAVSGVRCPVCTADTQPLTPLFALASCSEVRAVIVLPP